MSLAEQQFIILNSDTVFKSQKLQIDRAKISLPNGNEVEWDANVMPDFYYGIPIENEHVIMTKEWRYGPNKLLTQFTGARCISSDEGLNLNELKREIKEELGIDGGNYDRLICFQWGFRTTGVVTCFLITDFNQGHTDCDENELLEHLKLPIKGLYMELLKNHIVTADTLLVAKLLEEKYAN